MRYSWAGLLAVSACVGDSPTTSTPDASQDSASADTSVDAGSDVDGSDANVTCKRGGAFEANPALVAGLGGTGTPRLSLDELTAYFEVYPDGGSVSDVYTATRSDRNAAFGAATALGFNSPPDQDYMATVSGDGLRIIFIRSAQSPSFHLYVSDRNSKAAQFQTAAALVGGINTANWETSPYLVPSGETLYFASTAPNAGKYGLMKSALVSGSFGAPVPLAELNTSDEINPVVTADELEIFWASTRTDLGPKGGYDVYTATRTATNQPFANVRNVMELNGATHDAPTWISPDGCRLYLSRGGTGIMMARRTP